MVGNADRKLRMEMELLLDRWSRDWALRARNNTQLSLEDERIYLRELKKIIVDFELGRHDDKPVVENE